MNGLLWIVQILLAAVFLISAAGKLFAYDKVARVVESRTKGHAIGLSRQQAALVALAELAGAVAVILPFHGQPGHFIVLMAAFWLAFLMVGASIYHAWRHEPAVPSVVLFLLALFIIVGRWPQ
jgi:uncharacterized membrane protein YphA (DoxX/SURF4 family)